MTSSPTPAMPATKPKSDMQIKTDVLSELKWEPAVKVTDIGVQVKDGVVTLTGSIGTHGEKRHAMHAARRVSGVKAIADAITITLATQHQRTDSEIASAAVHQLEWSTTIPKGSTKVSVHEGWVTLEGEVEWWYQRNAAEDVLLYMIGVKGIKNLITLKPTISIAGVEAAIRAPLNAAPCSTPRRSRSRPPAAR
jgi:osmotically-inducible protein OsmY